MKFKQIIIIILTSVISSMITFFIVNNNINKEVKKNANVHVVHDSSNITKSIKKVKNGVVTVINRTKIDKERRYLTFEDFLAGIEENDDSESKLVDQAQGSGFIFKKQNDEYYILTNNHVIEGAKELDIMISNNNRIKVNLVGRIPQEDLAVIKFKSNKNLPVLEFMDSNYIQLGEDAIAIGSPLSSEYKQTVTKGIVSKLPFKQEISEDNYKIALQTDAAINPGNSGGPLLNENGLVMGINTFKRDGAENLNFALPSNHIKEIADEIIKKGNK